LPILFAKCHSIIVSTKYWLAFLCFVNPPALGIKRHSQVIILRTLTVKTDFFRLLFSITIAITEARSTLAHRNVKVAIVFITPGFSRSVVRTIPCCPPDTWYFCCRVSCAIGSQTIPRYFLTCIFHFFALIIDLEIIAGFIFPHETVEIETLFARIGKKLRHMPIFRQKYPTQRTADFK